MPPRKPGRSAAGRKKNSRPSAKKKPAGTRKSPLVRAALWTAASLAILFALFLLVSLLLFSPYRKLGEPKLEQRHYQTLNRMTSRVASQGLRRDPPAELRLRLSPDEVNDLLELARATAGFDRSLPPPWSFRVAYRADGSFEFVVPLDAAPEWLFGGQIYARGTFRLEKQDEKLLLEIPELRLGRSGISPPGGGTFAGKSGEEALKEALPPEFDEAVKAFYPEEDGTLVLVCRTEKLLPLLLKFTR